MMSRRRIIDNIGKRAAKTQLLIMVAMIMSKTVVIMMTMATLISEQQRQH